MKYSLHQPIHSTGFIPAFKPSALRQFSRRSHVTKEDLDICALLQAVATGTLHMPKALGHGGCALSWLVRAREGMFPVLH